MSKIIIGIHGMGNKPERDQLRKWWKNALCEGLTGWRSKGLFSYNMAYWAAVLHDRPLDAKLNDSGDPFFLKEPYVPGGGAMKKTSDDKPLSRKIRDQINEQLDRIIMEEDGTSNFSRLSDFIIRHFVKDLEAYYRNSDEDPDAVLPREKICRILIDVLRKHKNKKIMLIAHSMGSIIAWDVLSTMVPDIKIHTFVTIGSPLGIPFVKSRIIQDSFYSKKSDSKLRTPENITHYWYNLADFHDKVAFNYDLNDEFLPNSRCVRPEDKLVSNDYEIKGEANHHKSYGYLRCREMADLVKDFLG